MDLVTASYVLKDIMDQGGNAAAVNRVTRLVGSVSAKVERLLERHVQAKQRTEYYGIPFGSTRVFLKGYPVTEILRVWNDEYREFGIDDDTVTTTVSGNSAADQTDLTVADSSEFSAGDVVVVNEGGARDEELTVSSAPDGTTLRMTGNLVYTHTAAQADEVMVVSTVDTIDSSYYTVPGEEEGRDPGILFFDYVLSEGAKALKIRYTGGMAEDTDAFMDAFPDLRDAVANQVAYEYYNRDSVGLDSKATKMGSTPRKLMSDPDYFAKYGDMIPDLSMLIERYRRRTL